MGENISNQKYLVNLVHASCMISQQMFSIIGKYVHMQLTGLFAQIPINSRYPFSRRRLVGISFALSNTKPFCHCEAQS